MAKTLDKKYNLDDVENRKHLKITADLNDTLRRDLLISPVNIDFGITRVGMVYRTTITV